MQLTKSQIKNIIQEEVQRITENESNSDGKKMADTLFEQFNSLSSVDQQIFLENFVRLVGNKIAWHTAPIYNIIKRKTEA